MKKRMKMDEETNEQRVNKRMKQTNVKMNEQTNEQINVKMDE